MSTLQDLIRDGMEPGPYYQMRRWRRLLVRARWDPLVPLWAAWMWVTSKWYYHVKFRRLTPEGLSRDKYPGDGSIVCSHLPCWSLALATAQSHYGKYWTILPPKKCDMREIVE